jgi:YgiT-type zinc finger domain-containing protein
MHESKGTYFANLAHGYVIIENVPCWKCDQCGEIVFSASVLEKINVLIERLQKVSSKIFLLDYDTAA